MSYLKMALAALQAATSAGEAGAQRGGFTSQARTAPRPRLQSSLQRLSPQEHVITCSSCPPLKQSWPEPRQGWAVPKTKQGGTLRHGSEKALAPGPKYVSIANPEN
jgi:hypothetical protein